MQWKDITVQIVSIDGLATMKKLAGRTQDLLDLEKLSLKNEDEEA